MSIFDMHAFNPILLAQICINDLIGVRQPVYSLSTHAQAALNWLKIAQDASPDRGVAAWYGFWRGWAPSFIETTGYICSTFLDASKQLEDQDARQRAIEMGDFLVSMQLPSGAYRAYPPPHLNSNKSFVFNVGQDILGLTDLYQTTNDEKYLYSSILAADYLVHIQNSDGTWTKDTYDGKPHAYHSRVAWSLLRVYELTGVKKYKLASTLHLDWVLSMQNHAGWFDNNTLPNFPAKDPITHTIAYANEGLLYSSMILKNKKYSDAVVRGMLPLLHYFEKHQRLPATFSKSWETSDSYSCLTGLAQVAKVWLELSVVTKDARWLKQAQLANKQLCQGQILNTDDPAIKGAIKGSDPIMGDILQNAGYCRLAYPNWAAKFFIDSLLTEQRLTKG